MGHVALMQTNFTLPINLCRILRAVFHFHTDRFLRVKNTLSSRAEPQSANSALCGFHEYQLQPLQLLHPALWHA